MSACFEKIQVYLFSLVEDDVLDGTYSQYKTPKLIWNSILSNADQIQSEGPDLFNKISKMNQMNLTGTF